MELVEFARGAPASLPRGGLGSGRSGSSDCRSPAARGGGRREEGARPGVGPPIVHKEALPQSEPREARQGGPALTQRVSTFLSRGECGMVLCQPVFRPVCNM